MGQAAWNSRHSILHLAAVKLFLVLCSCQIPWHNWPRKPWLNFDDAIVQCYFIDHLWRHWLNWSPGAILYVSVANRNAPGAQFSHWLSEEKKFKYQFSKGIDSSVRDKMSILVICNYCFYIVFILIISFLYMYAYIKW